MHSAASRSVDDLSETRREYEERMCALRSELEQQEVDKAALLDIVQVHGSPLSLCWCCSLPGSQSNSCTSGCVLHRCVRAFGQPSGLVSVQAGADTAVYLCLAVCPSLFPSLCLSPSRVCLY